MFLDGPAAKPSEAVNVIFAHEKVRESDLHLTPDVDNSEQGKFSVLSLEALVQMKLTSFRRKDQTHLEDMIGVDLIDRSWIERVPQIHSGFDSTQKTFLSTPRNAFVVLLFLICEWSTL